MYVPFISTRDGTESRLTVFKRKGGGGGSSSNRGGSSKGGSSSSTKSSSSSSGSGKSSSSSSGKSSSSSGSGTRWWSTTSSSTTTKYKTKTVWKTTSSSNTRKVGVAAAIPAGDFFAGRIAGGGTRSQVFGTRTYGSGYPGILRRGTSGRGFPFFFWPIAWPLGVGGAVGAGSALYLHNQYEYGTPTNASRPGGPLAFAILPSTSKTTPSTYRLLADTTTISVLMEGISSACSTYLTTIPQYPVAFDEASYAPLQPEHVVQYYRASTAALLLEGYNNTATYAVEGTVDSSLPATADLGLLGCLNDTIGGLVPLIDGAGSLQGSFIGGGHGGLAVVVGVVWWLVWLI